MKISGFTMVRNAIQLDYPVHLTINSLLALSGCDEVVVGVAESTDDTLRWLETLYRDEKRVRLIPQPWHDPKGDVRWWTKWINETRQHLSYPQQLMLDADEVIEPLAFRTLWDAPEGTVYSLRRLNYWRDTHHLCPEGHTCSHKVVRFAPSNLWMTSDEIYGGHDFPEAEPEIRKRAVERMDLRIHHLGFLRKREALFAKVEVCLRAFFGQSQDSRLLEAMRHPEVHWTTFCQHSAPLIRYYGTVPELAKEWLRERDAL